MIDEYDIDGYLLKTELTTTRLYSSVRTAIKAYEEPRIRLEEVETPRPTLHTAPDDATIPMAPEEPSGDWEAEFEEDTDSTPLDESPEADAPAAQAVEEGPGQPAGAAGEDDKPRRGRRRRRRGRRRGGDRDDEGRQEARPPAPAPAGHKPREGHGDPRDERGRRPPRPRDDAAPPRRPQPPVPSDDELTEVEHEPAPARPRLTESDTDFSDWNVPSWQDLIAALYRPDR
ncbi:MAG: hypothetical protein HY289_12705 [Planctomycetes bacterium]|nr:hypothetical protein [Planctomycetota bacterium]